MHHHNVANGARPTMLFLEQHRKIEDRPRLIINICSAKKQ